MSKIPTHNGGGHFKDGRSIEGRFGGNKLLRRTALVAILFFALYLLSRISSPTVLFSRQKSSISTIHNPARSLKPNAKFVILVRERELAGLLPSIRDLQWAFNDDLEHGYDYVSFMSLSAKSL